MDWFSRKLILAHGIFNYFRSTCFRETNKILIFPWIYFRKYREIIQKKKKKKKLLLLGLFIFPKYVWVYFITVCFYCHIHGYKESTFCNSLTVKELLAQDRRDIWKLTDFHGTRTNKHLHRKRRINHLVQMGECSLTN